MEAGDTFESKDFLHPKSIPLLWTNAKFKELWAAQLGIAGQRYTCAGFGSQHALLGRRSDWGGRICGVENFSSVGELELNQGKVGTNRR